MPLKSLGILLLCLSIVAPKGVYAQFKKRSQTRAVIIGVSDYQDDKIPDLNFAHRDAQAYADFLKSKAGGSVPEKNIRILTDSMATCGNTHNALNWLLEESKSNDKAVIYFSGHGDVESIDNNEAGHFLLYNTSSSLYQLCSFKIEQLQNIVRQLTTKNKSKVTVITDACRSGKLAGEAVHGSQATASALLQQFGNEVKIMSCQPNEYSIEGEKWGGGRGAFSYYLINGLYGLADNNHDDLINLGEIDNYLEIAVGDAVKPVSQTPFTSGDKKAILSTVDPEEVAEISEVAEDKEDQSVTSIKVRFNKALVERRFLPDATGNPSAIELFESMQSDNKFKPALMGLKGDFVAALQDDVQKSIKAYLKSDNDELAERWNLKEDRYAVFPQYMELASELLGQEHYLYRQMIAKKFYFEAVNLRIQGEKQNNDENLFYQAKEKIESALLYEDRAAYLFNELGLILSRLNDPYCVDLYQRAIDLSPTWALPYNNLARFYLIQKNYAKATELANKALELQADFFSPYYNLSKIAEEQGKQEEKIRLLQIARQYWDSSVLHIELGRAFLSLGRLDSAINHYELAIARDTLKAESYNYLGIALFHDMQFDKAKYNYSKAIALDSQFLEAHSNLGWSYFNNGDYENAEDCYLTALNIDGKHLNTRLNYGLLLFVKSRLDEAEIQYKYILQHINDKSIWGHYMLACVYAKQNKIDLAIASVASAIESGFIDYNLLSSDIDLSAISQEPEFKRLLKSIEPE